MRIFIINQSDKLGAGAAGLIAQAINKQFSDHYGPAWGQYVTCDLAGPDDPRLLEIDVFPLRLIDTDMHDGSLGEHDDRGGVVEVPVIYEQGGDDYSNPACSVSAVASHEALEMANNAAANSWWQMPDGRFVAAETADPVQGDSYPIEVLGQQIMVSNFIRPKWMGSPVNGGRYDHLGLLDAPFRLRPSGYWITTRDGIHVESEFGALVPEWKRERLARKLGRPKGRLGALFARAEALAARTGQIVV